MKKKLQSITNILIPATFVLAIIIIWEVVARLEVVPSFMLPSFSDCIKAFVKDFPLLMKHTAYTLAEAFAGLGCGIALALAIALLMDNSTILYKGIKPLMTLSQTIPTVCIAPLLVLWFGYEMLPKIILITITTFFPIAVGLLDGFKSVDKNLIALMQSMNASKFQIYRYAKFPNSLVGFFSGLKISVTYSIVGAVISEWLGGFYGLGVYIIRVKKAYSFDKMFAAILLISALSLILMMICELLSKHFTKNLKGVKL